MPDSVYKIIELVGTSPNNFAEAVKNTVETAAKSLEDLRIAEVVKLDVKLDDNKVVLYRARVRLSFKYKQE
ncbi:MAG: transporter [Candidatus Lokiarchaeota archaeon]|nr:transporter [Candidatus Lokiarchaeota archaeon]